MFWNTVGSGGGTCHRLPPNRMGFPKVDGGDWCGEFKAGDPKAFIYGKELPA